MTTTNTTKTLSHGDLIRIAGFKYGPTITVFTISGWSLEEGADPQANIDRAIHFGHSIDPTTIKAASFICADFPGKHEQIDAQQAAIAAAPELAEGEIVEIEGKQYRTSIVGQNLSDPVHFIPVTA